MFYIFAMLLLAYNLCYCYDDWTDKHDAYEHKDFFKKKSVVLQLALIFVISLIIIF